MSSMLNSMPVNTAGNLSGLTGLQALKSGSLYGNRNNNQTQPSVSYSGMGICVVYYNTEGTWPIESCSDDYRFYFQLVVDGISVSPILYIDHSRGTPGMAISQPNVAYSITTTGWSNVTGGSGNVVGYERKPSSNYYMVPFLKSIKLTAPARNDYVVRYVIYGEEE